MKVVKPFYIPLIIAAFAVLNGCGFGGGKDPAEGGMGPGTATLVWTAPTTNADGSPIYDLAGYKVYYGTSSGVCRTVAPITVRGAGRTVYSLIGLAAGDYYFTVTAYDTSLNESICSIEVMKTVS